MPKRFTSIGAILFGVIAAGQVALMYYGLHVVVGEFQVPAFASWATVGVSALLCVMLFREANA